VVVAAVITRTVATVSARVRRRGVQVVRVRFIDERTADSHPLGDLRQHGIGIAGHVVVVEAAVIPVVASAELAITEGILGKRHVDGSVSNLLRGPNRFSVLPTQNLEIPATANEVIHVRIDGEQHADTSFRIGVKYHEVPVVFDSYVHAYTVAEIEIVLAVEPHL